MSSLRVYQSSEARNFLLFAPVASFASYVPIPIILFLLSYRSFNFVTVSKSFVTPTILTFGSDGFKGDIYLPVAAAPAKVHLLETMIGSNTNIKLFKHGSDCSQAETEARRRAEESDKIYLSPYNDSDVIAGQGTIGVEIVEQMKQLQTETGKSNTALASNR